MRTQALPTQTIHLWCASFAALPWPLARLQRLLTAEELDKASRYQRAADQQRMMASRGMLRLLLARYLGSDPASIPLMRTPAGKPSLAPTVNPGLTFSVSHTPHLVVYALGADEVGVDVEWVDRLLDWARLAPSLFDSADLPIWQALAPGQRQQAAVAVWTTKEAVFKAAGGTCGLRSIKAVEVGIERSEPLRLRVRVPQAVPRPWQVVTCTPAPGHLASVCACTEHAYPISQRWLGEEAFDAAA